MWKGGSPRGERQKESPRSVEINRPPGPETQLKKKKKFLKEGGGLLDIEKGCR